MSGVELMLNMMVPFIIAVVALYGMLRRVDVYDALVCRAGDGLGVLIRIVPPLIGLLTAVYMLRASGALELAAGTAGPHPGATGDSGRDHRAAAGTAGERQRGPGGGGRPHPDLRPGLAGGAHSCGDAGVHGDDLLYHRRLLWRGGDRKDPLCGTGGAVCRLGGVYRRVLGRAGPVLWIEKRPALKAGRFSISGLHSIQALADIPAQKRVENGGHRHAEEHPQKAEESASYRDAASTQMPGRPNEVPTTLG